MSSAAGGSAHASLRTRHGNWSGRCVDRSWWKPVTLEQRTADRERKLNGDDIAERLLALGAAAMVVVGKLEKNRAGNHVAAQLVRCGTAGGAHYEARGAESRADFVHKVRLAAKEVRESVYWMRLARRADLLHVSVEQAVQEGSELAAILAASATSARASR
ncbi:MAG: four helix bundle protein [Deltaproteobacteria bacterium]|nr:four helix bundle protein [Deltaproteobacteria bacterium]